MVFAGERDWQRLGLSDYGERSAIPPPLPPATPRPRETRASDFVVVWGPKWLWVPAAMGGSLTA